MNSTITSTPTAAVIRSKHSTYTHEELYSLAHEGSEQALLTLCTDYKPLFISASEPYRNRMESMGMDDFIQEGWICIWKVCKAGNFRSEGGSFAGYIKKAYGFHLARLWRDYILKNPVCTMEVVHGAGSEDAFTRCFGSGYGDRYYKVSEKAEAYRKEQRARNKRYREQKAAETDAERQRQGLPPIWRPGKATEEEKAAHAEEIRLRRNARVKAYQQEHARERKAYKAEYYQKNKRRYRVLDAIRKAKLSIEKYETEGREQMAEKARARLAKYEAELEEIKAAG